MCVYACVYACVLVRLLVLKDVLTQLYGCVATSTRGVPGAWYTGSQQSGGKLPLCTREIAAPGVQLCVRVRALVTDACAYACACLYWLVYLFAHGEKCCGRRVIASSGLVLPSSRITCFSHVRTGTCEAMLAQRKQLLQVLLL